VGYYVIQAKSNQINRASVELARQGYGIYVPVLEGKPYFPSYLFMEEAENWWPVRSTYGVLRILLSPSGSPYQLSGQIVQAIKTKMAELSAPPPPPKPVHQFKTGERVIVTGEHILKGHEGLFQRDAHGRTMALLDLLSGKKVQVPVANIAPLSAA
jgi:transcriptional antiterminator RfaH